MHSSRYVTSPASVVQPLGLESRNVFRGNLCVHVCSGGTGRRVSSCRGSCDPAGRGGRGAQREAAGED